jgi:hypothetical protein
MSSSGYSYSLRMGGFHRHVRTDHMLLVVVVAILYIALSFVVVIGGVNATLIVFSSDASRHHHHSGVGLARFAVAFLWLASLASVL